jgi:hypothetical protein
VQLIVLSGFSLMLEALECNLHAIMQLFGGKSFEEPDPKNLTRRRKGAKKKILCVSAALGWIL